ncbi:MAG: fasciclin domain-containing protein, partial [Acidimicrobiia bacterium]
MNYEDQVLALFGEANPVSDLDTLEDLMSPRLEVVEQRTGDMTDTKVREIDPNRPIFKKDRRFGLVYGLAAALVVLMIGSVVWAVFLNDSEPDVAPQPAPTPTTVLVEEVAGPNLLEVAASTGQYDTFLELVQISGFDETLSAGTFTVFAPTDDAFAALPADLLESLKTSPNPTILEDILGNLTMAVQLDSSQLTAVANGDGFLANVAGSTIFVAVDDDGTLTLEPTGF